jgi:hypothetical protein
MIDWNKSGVEIEYRTDGSYALLLSLEFGKDWLDNEATARAKKLPAKDLQNWISGAFKDLTMDGTVAKNIHDLAVSARALQKLEPVGAK